MAAGLACQQWVFNYLNIAFALYFPRGTAELCKRLVAFSSSSRAWGAASFSSSPDY